VGAHGWVAGIVSHGSVSLSRGWLISVDCSLDIPGTHLPLSLMQLLNNDFIIIEIIIIMIIVKGKGVFK